MSERLARLPFGDDWRAAGEPTSDVMDVRSRMAMYRLLVERTNLHGAFGAEAELSPFWGYASQLAWQHRSGRLGTTSNVIDGDSWWGACNYALCVVPYVAAMQLGLVPAIAIAHTRAYDIVMPAWRAAFVALTSSHDLDASRLVVWRAHRDTIALAVRLHGREHRLMPSAERRFVDGWVRMVDLFAAAGLRTDLVKLAETGGGTLPSRLLDDAVLAALPRHERSVARRVSSLADRPPWRWAIDIAVWRRIMRTRAARADVDRLLAGMLGRGKEVWPARLRALAYAALPARLIESLGRGGWRG
jgi:Leg1